MNSLRRALAAFLLMICTATGALAAPQATAAANPASPMPGMVLAQSLPGSSNNNPYNSPIRRANPNSMQGTQPNAPAIRGPNTVPVQRPPTLENGGIGNGYPRTSSPPPIIDPRPQTAPRGNQQQR